MAVDQEFRDELNVFMGEMRQFRDETIRRLDRGDARMSAIEDKIAAPSCVLHAGIVESVTLTRDKVEEHEKAIAELRTDTAVVKSTLSNTDLAKVGSIAGVIATVLVKVIQAIWKF